MTPWTVAYQATLSTGILQARTLEWVVMPLESHGLNPGLPHYRLILNHLSHQGRPLSWLNMTSNKMQRCPADPSLTMCPSCLFTCWPCQSRVTPGHTIRHFTGDHRALLYRSNSFPQISPQVPDAYSHFNGWPFLASQISL